MRRRVVLPVVCVALLGACVDAAPERFREAHRQATENIVLPDPIVDGPVSLEEALAARRSERDFDPGVIAASSVGQLLWAGQGVTSAAGGRTAPSAGGLHPIELYAVTSTTVDRYLPGDHAVERRVDDSALERLADSAFGQRFVGEAPLVVVISGVVERTQAEYGGVAESFVDREAGHVAQNVLLQATALGLASVPVGGFDAVDASQALSLPPGEEVLYLIPIG